MHQKGFSNILLIIIGIIFVFLAIGIFTTVWQLPKLSVSTPAGPTVSPSPVVAPTPVPAPAPVPPQALACGITVTSPAANAAVGPSINITGSVDGSCHWNGFEGQTGTVQAFDSNGNPVTATAVLGATSDWMTLPVSFSARLTITTPPEHTNHGYLLFQNEDPSGQFPETYQLPIRFQ